MVLEKTGFPADDLLLACPFRTDESFIAFCLLLISSIAMPPEDTSWMAENPEPPPMTSRLLATVRPFTDALSSMIFILRELDMPDDETLLLVVLSMYTSWLVLLDTDRNSGTTVLC